MAVFLEEEKTLGFLNMELQHLVWFDLLGVIQLRAALHVSCSLVNLFSMCRCLQNGKELFILSPQQFVLCKSSSLKLHFP